LTNCYSLFYIEFRYRNRASKNNMDDKSLYSGLIRLHILHHAAEEPLYGIWIAEELARHGYRLSAGTLYPILHGLESKGYLRSHSERNGKSARRMYKITPLGRKALRAARRRVQELFGEMFGVEHHH
jgi:DNA-binding PadR family transcriptional regulator